MSVRDSQFLARWHAERDNYGRWGEFIVRHIKELLAAKLDPKQAAYFVRIPATPRLKDDESLLQKAFYRPKNYSDPYVEIEDKVGVRFVVLLSDDVKIVKEAILSESTVWSAIVARDHEEEIAENPYEFNYQSVHLILRSQNGQQYSGFNIPDNLPCEVQVRTLLQHAYSEVSHDTLYKPSIKTTPAMKRAAAKSMALIEATSDYFNALASLIDDEVAPLKALSKDLDALYAQIVGKPATASTSPLNHLLLDRYGRDVEWSEIENWFAGRKWIGERIKERAAQSASFRVPSVLLVYFCAKNFPHGTPINCPLPENDLELVYGDLGDSLNG
ncbi:GTP pyrophosphokinase family protein [Roseibium alexandrii]|uniref:GTP pyrophosphokinase n=1 Tax=Roseibium alexandrii TaxID=388408 RepID=UPI003753E0EF